MPVVGHLEMSPTQQIKLCTIHLWLYLLRPTMYKAETSGGEPDVKILATGVWCVVWANMKVMAWLMITGSIRTRSNKKESTEFCRMWCRPWKENPWFKREGTACGRTETKTAVRQWETMVREAWKLRRKSKKWVKRTAIELQCKETNRSWILVSPD